MNTNYQPNSEQEFIKKHRLEQAKDNLLSVRSVLVDSSEFPLYYAMAKYYESLIEELTR